MLPHQVEEDEAGRRVVRAVQKGRLFDGARSVWLFCIVSADARRVEGDRRRLHLSTPLAQTLQALVVERTHRLRQVAERARIVQVEMLARVVADDPRKDRILCQIVATSISSYSITRLVRFSSFMYLSNSNEIKYQFKYGNWC